MQDSMGPAGRLLDADTMVDMAETMAETTLPADRPEQIRTLAEFAVRHDLRHARALVDARLEEGEDIESILLSLLAPTARLLGEQWDDDTLTFTEVTIGLGRLEDIHRRLDEQIRRNTPLAIEAPRILMAVLPGSQHTFGAALAATLMCARGWDVSGTAATDEWTLVKAASNGWFDVIGLSRSCDRFDEAAARVIPRMRGASLNPDIRIVLGGVLATQEVARALGADDYLADIRELAG